MQARGVVPLHAENRRARVRWRGHRGSRLGCGGKLTFAGVFLEWHPAALASFYTIALYPGGVGNGPRAVSSAMPISRSNSSSYMPNGITRPGTPNRLNGVSGDIASRKPMLRAPAGHCLER